jgi:hypothetical protein
MDAAYLNHGAGIFGMILKLPLQRRLSLVPAALQAQQGTDQKMNLSTCGRKRP